MIINLFSGNERIMDKFAGVEIDFLHVNAGDLVVIITGVVESAFGKIVTVGIDGDFVFVVAEVGTTALLVDGMENMDELADIAEFVVAGERIEFGEGDFGEARFGRKITR